MSNSIDQQFIEFVVKSLVSNPDAVSVARTIDEKGVLLELTVDPEDLGRVIGKRGATAQSLRTLLRALGTKNDARYNLKIVDNGDGGNRPPRTNDSAPDAAAAQTDNSTPQDDTDPSEDEAAEEKTENTETPEKEEAETDHSDVISKTRAELDDLDDLDI